MDEEMMMVVAFATGAFLSVLGFSMKKRVSGNLEAVVLREMRNQNLWTVVSLVRTLSGLSVFVMGFVIWPWWQPIALWLVPGLASNLVAIAVFRREPEFLLNLERFSYLGGIIAAAVFWYLYLR